MFAEVSHVVTSPPNNDLVYILAAILSGSVVTAIVSWLKLHSQGKVEKEELVSRAAEQAVKTLESALQRLEVELLVTKRKHNQLSHELDTTIIERGELQKKVTSLSERVDYLEMRVERYKFLLKDLKKPDLDP